MPDDDRFWEFYWENRLLPMENLGKREAVLEASRLMRRMAQETNRPLRVLEAGCGEAQVAGALLDAHAPICDSRPPVGIDMKAQSLSRCRRDYPAWQWLEGDFTDPDLLRRLGQYDLLLLVNALHEVFSAEMSAELGEVDVPAGKRRVEEALSALTDHLAPGGWLLLFDGLEPPGDPQDVLRIRFADRAARAEFDTFAAQYQPFRIRCEPENDALTLRLTRRDFTRYVDKSIFLGKALWQSERLESYQYFTEAEFRIVFARLGLEIEELRTLTMNEDKWHSRVEILTPGETFPEEHILILARRAD